MDLSDITYNFELQTQAFVILNLNYSQFSDILPPFALPIFCENVYLLSGESRIFQKNKLLANKSLCQYAEAPPETFQRETTLQ